MSRQLKFPSPVIDLKATNTYTNSYCDWLIETLKPVFHFSRIVAKRSVFHCFGNTQAEQILYDSIEVETGLKIISKEGITKTVQYCFRKPITKDIHTR